MVMVHSCLDEATLAHLAGGRLPEGEAAGLEEHLRDCRRCAAAYERQFETVIEALRHTASPEQTNPDQGLIDDLIVHLKGLTRPPATLREDAGSRAAPEFERLGQYKVLRVLGEGGMGTVYEGEDEDLHRRVALKVMKAGCRSEASRRRFLREARSAAALNHDNIVPVLHVGEQEGVPFIAMPLLDGETLASRLRREPKLPLPLVVQIGREVAAGLAAAHEKGLTHRDVKPANVWLEDRGDGVRARLLDFGLARAEKEAGALTQIGTLVGTPQYMAPEQARGETVDGRADLFSLGCVLYEASTGVRPFEGPSVMATLSALENRRPKPPHELNPDVPRELSDLVMRLLEKERERRPASSAAVAEALSQVGRPSAVHMPPRHRVLVALMAACLACVVLGGVVVIVKGVKIEVQEDWTVVVDKDGNVLLRAPGGKPPEPMPPPRAWQWQVQEVTTPLSGLPSPASIAFTPEGDRLLIGLEDSTVRGTDFSSGKEIYSVPHGGGPVVGLAVSPDGKRALSGGPGGNVLRWDVAGGKEFQSFRGHTDIVYHLAFSPDGRFAVSSGHVSDKTVRLWDVSTGKEVRQLRGHKDCVYGLAWMPDGKRIVGASQDGTVRLWDATTGDTIPEPFAGAEQWYSMALSPDGQSVAVIGYLGGVLELLAIKPTGLARRHPPRRLGGVGGWSVAFDPKGRVLVATAGRKGYFFDPSSGDQVGAFENPTDRAIRQIVFSPWGEHLVTVEEGGSIRLWKLTEKK